MIANLRYLGIWTLFLTDHSYLSGIYGKIC